MNKFNEQYIIDEATGAVRQRDLTVTQVYNPEYVSSRYNMYPREGHMSELRAIGVISLFRGVFGKKLGSVMDFGCGNGSFLRSCVAMDGVEAYGYDISEYPITGVGVDRTRDIKMPVNCVTFFDSLEHLVSPDEVLDQLNCQFIFISLPWCHFADLGPDWFMSWKHRRPGEHLWHFSPCSISKLMHRHGFKLIQLGNREDEIRRSDSIYPNILTASFAKK